MPMNLPVCKEDLNKPAIDGHCCWENVENFSIDMTWL